MNAASVGLAPALTRASGWLRRARSARPLFRTLGVGRSYTSRVIQTLKAERVLETGRGSLLIRNVDALKARACLCNESVKSHFETVLEGLYPSADDPDVS